jgi:hypothetical protein
MMVYPVPGRAVRDPVTKHVLSAAGLEVSPNDFFWVRRLRDGDVTTTAPVVADVAEAGAPEVEVRPATANANTSSVSSHTVAEGEGGNQS